jgi:hypothetical protein
MAKAKSATKGRITIGLVRTMANKQGMSVLDNPGECFVEVFAAEGMSWDNGNVTSFMFWYRPLDYPGSSHKVRRECALWEAFECVLREARTMTPTPKGSPADDTEGGSA